MAEAIRNGDELEVFAGPGTGRPTSGRSCRRARGSVSSRSAPGSAGSRPSCAAERSCSGCASSLIPRLLSSLESLVSTGALPGCCQARAGTIHEIQGDPRFDIIYYIDVLEHIEDDAAELRAASRLLARGGRLVVLAPAFPCLYSRFDRSIGHFRRYTCSHAGQSHAGRAGDRFVRVPGCTRDLPFPCQSHPAQTGASHCEADPILGQEPGSAHPAP